MIWYDMLSDSYLKMDFFSNTGGTVKMCGWQYEANSVFIHVDGANTTGKHTSWMTLYKWDGHIHNLVASTGVVPKGW